MYEEHSASSSLKWMLHVMDYPSPGGCSIWKVEAELEPGALCPLLCSWCWVMGRKSLSCEDWQGLLAHAHDGRRLSPAWGWFHLCTPRFAIQVSSFHHVKERFQLKPRLWTQLGCTGVGLQGEGKEKGFSPLISLHLPSFMARGLGSGSSAVLWGERDSERSKWGDKSRAWCGMLGREGLSPLHWHLGSFSPGVSKIPRPDLSLTPLPETFLSVAPGWDICYFFIVSQAALLFISWRYCCCHVPGSTFHLLCCNISSTSPLDISVARSNQHCATNIWGPALKEELLAHLFFFFWCVLGDIPSFLVTP